MDLNLGETRRLIASCKKHGLLRNQAAYLLATAYWETARTMRPVEEAFYLGSKAEAYRQKLRYAPWWGRGFVQLTWLENYQRAEKRLGVDLTTDPDRAMDPAISAEVIVLGMKEGWFTGKRLSDYITLTRSDFTNARRIVNDTDRAREIAALAVAYDKALLAEGYGVDGVDAPDDPTPAVTEPFPWAALWAAVRALLKRWLH